MEMMTDLSPAAQKALAAFNERHELCGPFDDDWVEQCLAAALEAVAAQLLPEPDYWDEDNMSQQGLLLLRLKRGQLLAIAADLRGDTTPTETP
jgi:hypothetical protein